MGTLRLLALDLEDILLGPDQTVAAEDVAALRSAAEQGVRVSLVTSRLADEVTIPGLECPIVAADGAQVTRGPTSVLALHALSPARAGDAVGALAREGLDVLALAPDGVHGAEEHAGLVERLVRGRVARFRPGPAQLRSVLELYGVGPAAAVERVLAHVRISGRTTADVIPIDTQRAAVRVRSSHATRARGLGDLAARLGIRRNDITYVGAIKPGADCSAFGWSGRAFSTTAAGLHEHASRGELLRKRQAPGIVAEALDRLA